MKQNIHTTPIAGFTSINADERKNLGIRAGDTVKVHQKIKEAAKNKKGEPRIRIQVFEGLVLSVKHGAEPGAMFTVRKVSNGVGIERIFPLYSPVIDKIEIVKRSKVRRSKLYYIRDKVAREIKRAMRKTSLSGESTMSDSDYQAGLQQSLEDEKIAAEEEAQAAEQATTETEAAVEETTEAPVEEATETVEGTQEEVAEEATETTGEEEEVKEEPAEEEKKD